MLKCLIVPLLVSSITSAIGSLDLSMSKKIAFRAIIYYFTTTICAVVLGIILVSTIRPGSGKEMGSMKGKATTRVVLTADTLLDLIRYVTIRGTRCMKFERSKLNFMHPYNSRNLFPPNIVQATMFQVSPPPTSKQTMSDYMVH